MKSAEIKKIPILQVRKPLLVLFCNTTETYVVELKTQAVARVRAAFFLGAGICLAWNV